MKNISLTAIAAMSMATCAMAADDLAGMFKEGKLDGRVRAQYFYTDWSDNKTTGKNKTDAKGLAVGGSLIYHTGKLNGFSAGAGVYTTQNPGGYTETTWGTTAGTSKDLFARDPNTSYGEGYSVLAQAYLQYNRNNTEAKAGRMLMTDPFINPNDTKMIPIAVEGASVVSTDLPNTTIMIDYATKIKERGMTYFGNMADTGDTPDAIKAYYTSHYSGTHLNGDAPAVTIVGVKNKSIDGLELQGWEMHWPDLVDQIMLEANYAVDAGPVILAMGGRYMQQFDNGAGEIILPKTGSSLVSSSYKLKGDTNDKVDTHLTAVRAAAYYQAAKLLLAYALTDKGGDMIAPWRGFPTDGYTRSMTQTDWNANTKSYKTQLDYDFNAQVTGLSALLSYAYYDRDPSKVPYQSMTDRAYQNGDTRQWNMDIVYKLAGAWKGTELKARFMDQQNSVTALNATTKLDTSNREMRLEANYRF